MTALREAAFPRYPSTCSEIGNRLDGIWIEQLSNMMGSVKKERGWNAFVITLFAT
jgi:hypothetical protein